MWGRIGWGFALTLLYKWATAPTLEDIVAATREGAAVGFVAGQAAMANSIGRMN